MQRYYIPTEIFFATGCISARGHRLSAYGTKALIVTGARSARLSGALDAVISTLSAQNIDYDIFDKVQENPLLSTITAGAAKFEESGCNFFIGIGGGSPIDAAKAMSAMTANHLVDNQIYDAFRIKKAFPIIAVPTTSGTGTEATPYSVVTDDARGVKAGLGATVLFPTISFLDPAFTCSLPLRQTRDTAIDALSHLLEGIYSCKRSSLLYPLIFDGIKRIIASLAATLLHPDDVALRTDLMQASLYGGIVIAQTSTTLQHSIGYPLTSELGVSHGLANGAVMRQIMELYQPAVSSELNALFAYIHMDMEEFFAWLAQFDLTINAEITDEFIARRTPEVLASRNMANNPFPIDASTIEKIYKSLR
ncbi:MAG: iron-containing alcohol dehydrogenase [Candidatus Cloacimonetes bacterium]|nr:iron-containing alcohol dehydrogenase [Candidatus Cloacimonadota bacterium]